MEVMWYQLR